MSGLVFLAAALVVAALVVGAIALNAPYGYEDKDGFHRKG
jgi:hypothetical protein